MKPEKPPEEIDAALWDANAAAFTGRLSAANSKLNKALRERLGKLNKAAGWPAEVKDRLAPRISTLTGENLAEWLEAGGWDRLTPGEAEKAEACFMAAWGPDRTPEIYMNLVSMGNEPYAMMGAAFPWIPRNTPKELHGPLQMAANELMKELSGGQDGTDERPACYALGLDCLAAWMSEPGGRLRLAEACLYTGRKADAGKDWLAVLGWAWLDEQAAEEEKKADARAKAPPLAIQARNVVRAGEHGDAFLRFPNTLQDIGAFSQSLVEVDGKTIFADEPNMEGMRVFKPRAWAVASERKLATPGQMVLPFMDPQKNPDLSNFLAVSATDAAAVEKDLGGVCAKLVPLLFALCPLDGQLIAGTYSDLVKLLWPDWKSRRQMDGDIERTGAALAALKGLQFAEIVRGSTLRHYPLFHADWMDSFTKPDRAAGVGIRLNPSLVNYVRPQRGKGPNFMLVNLSRLMDLNAKAPAKIAVALRLSAQWHNWKQKGEWVEGRADFIPVDDLLVNANIVSGRVAGLLGGQPGDIQSKKKLYDARSELVEKVLPDLQAAGILGELQVRRPGRGPSSGNVQWQVKPLPPPDYLEATRKASRRGRK